MEARDARIAASDFTRVHRQPLVHREKSRQPDRLQPDPAGTGVIDIKKILTPALALLLSTSALAAGYQIKWSSVNPGGGSMSGGAYKVSCSVGQPAATFVKGTNLLHWVGFWSGDVPTPTIAQTVGAAKLLGNGACVSVAGKIATSAAGDFADFFYIEEAERFSGIRVAAPPAAISGLARGSMVNVIGTMDTLPSGERQISGPIVIFTSTATPLGPVGMSGRNLGGADTGVLPAGQPGVKSGSGLNNIGILVKTWGRVTGSGQNYVEIDDGSGAVVIDTTTLASQPAMNSYISVIGIPCQYVSEGQHLRLILPRPSTDVKSH